MNNFYDEDMHFIQPQMSDLSNDVTKYILPIIEKWLDRGYSQPEIFFAIQELTSFELVERRLRKKLRGDNYEK